MILYTENGDACNKCLLNCTGLNIYNLTVMQSYFGIQMIIQLENIDALSSNICCYICENYLKDAVLTKIFDEYSDINASEAGKILINIFNDFSVGDVCEKLKNLLLLKHKLNVESYILFNIKYIMSTIYALVDECCVKYLAQKYTFY